MLKGRLGYYEQTNEPRRYISSTHSKEVKKK